MLTQGEVILPCTTRAEAPVDDGELATAGAPLLFVSNGCFDVLSDAHAARAVYCRRQSSALVFLRERPRWFLSHERHRFRGIGLAPILPFGRGLAAIKIVWNRHQRRIPLRRVPDLRYDGFHPFCSGILFPRLCGLLLVFSLLVSCPALSSLHSRRRRRGKSSSFENGHPTLRHKLFLPCSRQMPLPKKKKIFVCDYIFRHIIDMSLDDPFAFYHMLPPVLPW